MAHFLRIPIINPDNGTVSDEIINIDKIDNIWTIPGSTHCNFTGQSTGDFLTTPLTLDEFESALDTAGATVLTYKKPDYQ